MRPYDSIARENVRVKKVVQTTGIGYRDDDNELNEHDIFLIDRLIFATMSSDEFKKGK